jgi:CubicO group peptidase (beta-lactamase class C family)
MRRIAVAVIAVLIAAEVGGATPKELAKAIDAYVAPYVALHAFSGVILLARGDDVLVNRPYGMANYEFGVPNTPHTRFRLASITKRFTHTIITRLAEEKKIALNDVLAKFYPDFPKADKITIDHLVNHRSGIRDVEKLRRIVSSSYTPAEVVAIIAKEPLGSEPGETYSYTTANYAVLASIIEKVTGKSFADVMREMIYAPAGMSDSGEITTTTVIPRLASGYMPDPYSDGVAVCGPEDSSWKAGGGSSYSTTRDLHRFVRAYYGGKLLKASSPFDLIQHRKMFDKRYSQASGGFPGTSTNLTYFPDDEVTVVVLSNNYSPMAGTIAGDVAAIYFGQPYTVPNIHPPAARPALDPRVLGEWTLEGYPNFTVIERNGRNVMIWNIARQEAMIPLGNDEYFVPLDFAMVKFTFGETPSAIWTASWADHPLQVKKVK